MNLIMKRVYLAIATTLALCLYGCTNNEAVDNNVETERTGTVFFTSKDVTTRTHTKTDLTSKFEFFWDKLYMWGHAGDKIFVESTPGTWLTSDLGKVQDSEGRIATFNFPGTTLTDQDYMVYYGKSNSGNNIIEIPSLQEANYTAPSSQLIGDCGVGKAVRKASGNYTFKLHHKAAYAAVRWYCPNNTLLTSGAYTYYSVSIKADEPICGTYKLPNTENGHLTLVSPSSTNIISARSKWTGNVVSSTLANSDTTFFCIAPGTYHNVRIAVKMMRNGSYSTEMLVAGYSSITFRENELTPINIKLNVPDYSERYKFYMWGARNHYWYGYENEQKYDGTVGPDYPKEGDANGRYANIQNYPFPASVPQSTCPNTNETLWYIQRGNPIWDDRPFMYNGKLCYGGVWFKKKSKIPGFSNIVAPDGADYRNNPNITSAKTVTPTLYAGQDLSDYFYLPALDLFRDGKYISYTTAFDFRSNSGAHGSYWVNGPSDGGFRPLFPALEISGIQIRYAFTGIFSNTNYVTGTPLWKAE